MPCVPRLCRVLIYCPQHGFAGVEVELADNPRRMHRLADALAGLTDLQASGGGLSICSDRLPALAQHADAERHGCRAIGAGAFAMRIFCA